MHDDNEARRQRPAHNQDEDAEKSKIGLLAIWAVGVGSALGWAVTLCDQHVALLLSHLHLYNFHRWRFLWLAIYFIWGICSCFVFCRLLGSILLAIRRGNY